MTPAELMDEKTKSNIPLKYLHSKRNPVSVMTINETISISKHLYQLLIKTAKKRDSEPTLLLINDQLDEALLYFGVFKATQRLDVYSQVCDYLGLCSGDDKDAALKVVNMVSKFSEPFIVESFAEPQIGPNGLSCIDRGIYFKPRETTLSDDSTGISLLTNKRQLLLLLAGNSPEKSHTLTYDKIPPELRTPQLLAFSEYQRLRNNLLKNYRKKDSLDYEMLVSKDDTIKSPPYFYGMLSLLRQKQYTYYFEYDDSFEEFFSTQPTRLLTEDFYRSIDAVKTDKKLANVLNAISELNNALISLSKMDDFISKKGGISGGETKCIDMLRCFIQACTYSDACFDSLDELCRKASLNRSSLFKRISAEKILKSVLDPFFRDDFILDVSIFSKMNLNKPGLGIAELLLCCLDELGEGGSLKYAQAIASLPISTLCSIFLQIDRLHPAMAASIYLHAHSVGDELSVIAPNFYKSELAKFRALFKYKFAPAGDLQISSDIIDTLLDPNSWSIFQNGLSKDGYTLPLLNRADLYAKEMQGGIAEILDWEAAYVAQLFNNELQKAYSVINGSTDATHKHVNYVEPRF